MEVKELPPDVTDVPLREIVQSESCRQFRFGEHNYAVVRISDERKPAHITVNMHDGVLCFNLRSQTIRVLSWDTLVTPIRATVEVKRCSLLSNPTPSLADLGRRY